MKESFWSTFFYEIYFILSAWLCTDPDMLEVGNGGMKNNEYIAHFSLWAISKVFQAVLSGTRCSWFEWMHIFWVLAVYLLKNKMVL